MSGPSFIHREIEAALGKSGILIRGAVNFGTNEGPLLADGRMALSVILLGSAGSSIWAAFAQWRQTYDGPDPLDTWSKEIIGPLAARLGGTAYFPSDPPWQPFQQWAMRAEGLKPSPLGILIHPEFGLWHGYRGAIGFPFILDGGTPAGAHPCDTCETKPCLTTCPADAIGMAGFDVVGCRNYLSVGRGRTSCMVSGCIARDACPVGRAYEYEPAHKRFHMQALL
jgi:hypothetical protein